MTVQIDNRTTGASPTGSCSSLNVVCVEVAVAFAVFGRISIEPTNDTRQYAELLPGIVANYSDLYSHFCQVGPKFQLRQGHVLDGFRVETKDAEVVDRVAVDRVHITLYTKRQNSEG